MRRADYQQKSCYKIRNREKGLASIYWEKKLLLVVRGRKVSITAQLPANV